MRNQQVVEYWAAVHAIEAKISEPDAVLVSLATPQGGRAGVLIEAPAREAARMIVEKQAVLATPQQAAEFRRKALRMKQAEDKRQADVAEVLETARRLRNQALDPR